MLTDEWKKSSRSNSQGGACLEARWKKSSQSNNQGGACVEARAHQGVAQVRDTKLGESSPILETSAADWTAFLAAATRLGRIKTDGPRVTGGRWALHPAHGSGRCHILGHARDGRAADMSGDQRC
ncbi:DUF397 domain-containing protein [Glycomyces terrestris]|uniref:DUF397 domain-containing protein n=1 Tax=Glycomyces terrestris TaxID=2493553 RepID=A0A426V4K3_9ACTN|nr:DUF397 domain-containing protein [Glycomyces terrestris]RRS01765.1 DUF397 domain-containing protein [Glycomyces terrestris]